MRFALFALLLASSFAHAAETKPQLVPGLANETELGMVIASGNTRSQSTHANEAATYTFDANAIKLTGKYLLTTTSNVTTGKSWNLGLRYERALNDRLSVFLGQQVEGDAFAGYFQRYNTDAGLKAGIVKDDTLEWFAEAGYRYTSEHKTTNVTKTSHYARVYTEANKQWNASVSSKLWVEYLPNFTTSTDWQLNSEASITALLTSIFSLKTAYGVKYDNDLNTGVLSHTDRLFTTALVAKF